MNTEENEYKFEGSYIKTFEDLDKKFIKNDIIFLNNELYRYIGHSSTYMHVKKYKVAIKNIIHVTLTFTEASNFYAFTTYDKFDEKTKNSSIKKSLVCSMKIKKLEQYNEGDVILSKKEDTTAWNPQETVFLDVITSALINEDNYKNIIKKRYFQNKFNPIIKEFSKINFNEIKFDKDMTQLELVKKMIRLNYMYDMAEYTYNLYHFQLNRAEPNHMSLEFYKPPYIRASHILQEAIINDTFYILNIRLLFSYEELKRGSDGVRTPYINPNRYYNHVLIFFNNAVSNSTNILINEFSKQINEKNEVEKFRQTAQLYVDGEPVLKMRWLNTEADSIASDTAAENMRRQHRHNMRF